VPVKAEQSDESDRTDITFKALANNEDFFEEYLDRKGKNLESKQERSKRLL
jgi:hypothetical protein